MRVDWSDRVLGFECGGSQWVSEVAMPAGTAADPDGSGVRFVRDVLEEVVEKDGLPAPAPIEQRWTASSSSPMSPASRRRWELGRGPARPGEHPLFSWVGIIQYMPSADTPVRSAVTASFKHRYEAECRRRLWGKYHALPHWAKAETDGLSDAETRQLLGWVRDAYPVEAFEDVRMQLDPRRVLRNARLDSIVTAAALMEKRAAPASARDMPS